jgi:hypothetical protein
MQDFDGRPKWYVAGCQANPYVAARAGLMQPLCVVLCQLDPLLRRLQGHLPAMDAARWQ